MKKIKILRIIARLNIGGPAIHTVLLTAGLNKDIFESLLVCGTVSPGEGDMAYYAAEKGVQPLYVPELRRELNPLNDIIAFIKIFGIIKKEKPDVIHTHTAKAGTLGRIAAVLAARRAATVHTFHGHIFEGYFNGFLTRVFIFVEKILACFTDRIITVSEEVKKELVSLGISKADKIKVIPLGFELDRFLAIPDTRVSQGALRSVNIGIVGRLVPVKNHRLFLQAARDCIASGAANEDNLKFKIVGDGELRGELEDYARKLNISRYVEFTGWQKDLVKVYSELDIVCLTSLNEGTPVSLIEAMASAKAVIATDVGGVRDLLGEDRGIVVESGNVAAFAAALSQLVDNADLRQSLGMRAREFVRESFAKERLFKDIEDIYLNRKLKPKYNFFPC